MKVPIVQIGNSRGIRLAKAILERYAITDKVELVFKEDFFILKPVRNPREGWESSFAEMHERKEDVLMLPDVFHDEVFEDE